VPQAPTEEQKFIITGTKKGERPVPKIPEGSSSPIVPQKSFPGALVVVVILIFIGAAVAFVYHGTIFKSKGSSTTVASDTTDESNQSPVKAQTPSKPVAVAPPASDTNWMLSLDSVTNFPEAMAAGRVHGQDFIIERATLQGGTLTLREGNKGPVEFGVTINFSGAQSEALEGQSISVATNTDKAARVTLRWKDGEQAMRDSFDNGYALRLAFGALDNNHVAGKIYLCTPDESKSYIAGTFNAEIKKPKPPKEKD
jgi:hypothetical protein